MELFVTWRVNFILILTCTVVTFYSLPHVHLDQWEPDTWTWIGLRGMWTVSEKGLKGKFGKFGTVLQLKIWTILTVKKKNGLT